MADTSTQKVLHGQRAGQSKRKKPSAIPLRKRYLCTSSVLEELTFLPVLYGRLLRSKREDALCIAPPQGGVAAIEHTRVSQGQINKAIRCVWNKLSTSFQSRPLLMPISVPNNIRNEVVLLGTNSRWLIPEVEERPGLNSAAPCNIRANGEHHP